MITSNLNNFFTLSTSASASFIGLLFVALSVVTQKTTDTIRNTDRNLAESAYTALINIFFVSIFELIPNVNRGIMPMIMSIIGIIISVYLYIISKKDKSILGKDIPFFLIIMIIIYLLEAYYSIELIFNPKIISINYIIYIILTLFGVSLARSWRLMGMYQHKK